MIHRFFNSGRILISIIISIVLISNLSAQNDLVKNIAVPKAAKDGLFYMWLFDEGTAGHQFSSLYDTSNYWIPTRQLQSLA